MTARHGFIALGSNLGDRAGWLAFALRELAAIDGLAIVATTEPVETPPLGGMPQPDYLNAMARVAWDHDPESLLDACHRIEGAAGRDRAHHWAPRTLDLDLVRMDDELCDRPGLTLPHPGLRDRGFWARQIAELELHD